MVSLHPRRRGHIRTVQRQPGLGAEVEGAQLKVPLVVVEPNERLFPVIRRQVELNGGAVEFEHGAVLGGEDRATVESYLDEEIWFSSTERSVAASGERPRVPVHVPVLRLGDLLTRHRPTVLMVDIEGAEREVFVPPLPHRPATILVEIDAPIHGEREAAAVVQRIIDHGYRFVDQIGWTWRSGSGAKSPMMVRQEVTLAPKFIAPADRRPGSDAAGFGLLRHQPGRRSPPRGP